MANKFKTWKEYITDKGIVEADMAGTTLADKVSKNPNMLALAADPSNPDKIDPKKAMRLAAVSKNAKVKMPDAADLIKTADNLQSK